MVNPGRFFILLISLLAASAHAASFTVSVDRKTVALDEHVLLTFSLYNSDTRLRAQGVSPNIDLTLLADDFDVGTPRETVNYNIFRSRGRATSELVVELFPKREGTATIPPFSIDGLSSESVVIQVLPANEGQPPLALVRSGVNQSSPWRNQQLNAWLDVYYRVELESARLGGELETEPQQLELMEHQRLPQQTRQEVVDGIEYDVLRTSWAVFPELTGQITLFFPDAWLVTKSGKQLRLPNEKQVVTVKPLPESVADTLIVGETRLEVIAAPDTGVVNDAVSWRVKLVSAAALHSLPAYLDIPSSDAYRIYFDKAISKRETADNRVVNIHEFGVSMIPLQAGRFELPDVSLPYFDPDSGQVKSALASLGTITIAANATTNTTAAMPAQTPLHVSEPPAQHNDIWPLLTAVFATLWLTTAIIGWRMRRASSHDSHSPSSPDKPVEFATSDRKHLDALRREFGYDDLDYALGFWERTHGKNTVLREAVIAARRHYYGPDKQGDDARLARQVEEAIAILKTRPLAQQVGSDPWQPEALTPAHRMRDDR
jgi:hypothetical protein